MSAEKKKSSYRYPIILLVCVIAGGILGAILGEKATVVKPIGKIFINLLFTLIIPLVFFSIASAISGFKDLSRLGKMLGAVVGVFVATGAVASAFMLILIQTFSTARVFPSRPLRSWRARPSPSATTW